MDIACFQDLGIFDTNECTQPIASVHENIASTSPQPRISSSATAQHNQHSDTVPGNSVAVPMIHQCPIVAPVPVPSNYASCSYVGSLNIIVCVFGIGLFKCIKCYGLQAQNNTSQEDPRSPDYVIVGFPQMYVDQGNGPVLLDVVLGHDKFDDDEWNSRQRSGSEHSGWLCDRSVLFPSD
jgi:hypothetical protein